MTKPSAGTATFTVTNSGGGALSISNITSNNSQFSASPTSFNLSGGAFRTVTVIFTPTSAGMFSASLTLAHNAAPTATSSTVSVSGTGVDPAPAVPSGLVATAGNNQAVLTWTANTEADLSHYVVYRSTTSNFTPAATDSIARVAKPAATYTNTGLGAGTYYFTLAAVDSTGNKSNPSAQASAKIEILVKGGDPTPAFLRFTGSGSLSVAVTDSGNTSLTVTPAISGPEAGQFSVSPNAATTVAPGTTQSFTVTFAPSPPSGSNRLAILSLAHNATNKASPLTVALVGDVPPNAPVNAETTVALPGGATMDFVWIEPGTFTMGSPESEPGRDPVEGPQHQVTITKGFYLGKYEITQGQWQAVMGTTPWSGRSYVQANPNNPAVYISWNDVQALIHRLNQTAGDSLYRLPTEAEWEYACRTGTTTPWYFGYDESQAREYEWYAGNASDVGENYAHPVGAKRPNPWGLYDMAGNIAEWCQDFGQGLYASEAQVDPLGPVSGSRRVMRSGTFQHLARIMRSAYRHHYDPSVTYFHFGARLVKVTGTLTGADTTKPAVPAGLAATPGNGQVVLNWTANTEADLWHYVVYRSTTSNFTPAATDSIARVAKPAATYTNTGLGAGTYYFTLAAVDSTGNKSNPSAQASAKIEILVKGGDPNPASLRFVGSGSLSVTVSDSGNTSLSITPTISGTDAGQFSVSPNGATTVAPGATQSFTVTFTPSPAAGNNRSATLSLAHNATNKASPLTVALVGDVPPGAPAGETGALPNGATMEFVWIEPGTFTMGSASSESGRDGNEGPQHQVTISRGFYLGKYEITQAQWQAVMGTTPWSGQSYVQANSNNPVVSISWNDMQGFVQKLNDVAGEAVYRLPTEAEWEYACRAGTTTRWSFGDDESQLGNYAWYDQNAWNVGEQYAHQVGTKLPNPWGLYDMHGNVWEWVQDWFGSYTSSSQTDPSGPTSGSYRLKRGGSFGVYARYSRSASRHHDTPGYRLYDIGARLVAVSAGLTATPGNGQVVLNWTANAEADLSHYVVYRSTTNDFTPTPGDSIARVNKPTTTYTSTGLTAGTFYFKIAAVDSAGNKSSSSAQAQANTQSAISLSSTSVSTGNVNVGSSGAATFTVGSTGNAALNVTGITISGTDAAQFAVSPSTFTVNAGAAAQTVTVTFTPASAGSDLASLSISHNASGSPTTVSLSGTGTAPVCSLSSTSLAFGNVRTTTRKSLSFTVRNTGNAVLSVSAISLSGTDAGVFPMSPASLTVNPGEVARSVTVTFSPPAGSQGTAAKSAAVSLAHNAAGSPAIVSLTGTATAPAIAVSPSSLEFGTVNVGQTKSAVLTIGNTGTDTLFINTVGVTGVDATQFPLAATARVPLLVIGQGSSQALTVPFTPSGAGLKTATLSLSHNAAPAATSTSVSLSGTGDAPPAAPAKPTHTGGEAQVTVAWTANPEPDVSYYVVYRSPVSDFAPTAADSVGRVDQTDAPVFALTGLTKGVTYYCKVVAVDAGGNRSPASPQEEVALAVAGIEVTPSSLSFDSVRVGTTRTLQMTVSETGTAALAITSIGRSGADPSLFSVSPDSFTIADGGGPQMVTVTFAPPIGVQLNVPVATSLSFAGNAPENPVVTVSGVATAPVVGVLPVAFGSVGVGQTRSRNLAVNNTGTDTLFVTAVSVVGPDSGRFAVTPGTLMVPAKAMGLLSVTFTPTADGARNAALVLTHNSAPLAISTTAALTGTGDTAPAAPAGLRAVPRHQQVDLTWTANAEPDLAYYVVYRSLTDGFEPAPADSVGRVYQAAAPGYPQTGLTNGVRYCYRIVAVDAGGNRSLPSMQVSATPAAAGIKVEPTPLQFGNVRVGTSRSLPLTVSETGTADLVVTGIGRSGADSSLFSTSPTAFTIPEGGAPRVVQVTFAPPVGSHAVPAKNAGLFFADNAADDATVSLGGMATAPQIALSPAPLGFGTVAPKQSQTQLLTVTNNGTDTLLVTGVSLSGADASQFSVSPSQLTVAAGGSGTLSVTFAPSGEGAKSAILTLNHNPAPVAGGTQVYLTATGGGVRVSPSRLVFAQTALGQSSQKEVTVANPGTAPLEVRLEVTGINRSHFSVSPTTATIVASASLTFAVVFTPTTEGDKTAALTVTHNATNQTSPLSVQLSGMVKPTVGPPLVLPASVLTKGLTFGDVALGQSKSMVFTVGTTGNATLSVSGITVTGSGAEQFSVTPTRFTVARGATHRSVTVTFRPASAGADSAVLVITHNGSGGPVSIRVRGAGLARPSAIVDRELPFGTVGLSEPAIAKSLEVSNGGGGVLRVTNVVLKMLGSRTSPFKLVSADRFEVRAGESVSIQVQLTPTVAGASEGQLTLRFDPALGIAPITVALSAMVGEEVVAGPRLATDLDPSRVLSWGVVAVSNVRAEKSFTVQNQGRGVLRVSGATIEGTLQMRLLSAPRFEVAPGGSQVVTVSLTPQTAGKVTGKLTLVSNDADQGRLVIELSADVQQLLPQLITDQDPGRVLSWGTVNRQSSMPVEKSFTMTNQGAGLLRVSGITISGSGLYRLVSTARFELTPDASQVVTVALTPRTAGKAEGKLTIVSNDPTVGRLVFDLDAEVQSGSPPPARAPKMATDLDPERVLSWGTLTVSTIPVERSFAVLNQGDGPLAVSNTTIEGTTLARLVTARRFEVASGGSRTVTVSLTPRTAGQLSGQLVVTGNDASQGRLVIALSADIQEPAVATPKLATSLDPDRVLSWGRVARSQRAVEKTFAVSNVGTAPLQVSNISIIGAAMVRVVGATRYTVAPGGVQVVRVALTPKTLGKVAGKLILTSNDPTQKRASLQLTADVLASVSKVTAGTDAGSPPRSWPQVGGSRLALSYPNPFNQSTTIEYELSEAGEVQLSVYALSGQLVRGLAAGWQERARYTVTWDGRDEAGQPVGTGLYLGCLETGGVRYVRKLTLLK